MKDPIVDGKLARPQGEYSVGLGDRLFDVDAPEGVVTMICGIPADQWSEETLTEVQASVNAAIKRLTVWSGEDEHGNGK